MDTAKGISALPTNPGRLADYEGRVRVRNSGIPRTAIPTTAGTGSETIRFLFFR